MDQKEQQSRQNVVIAVSLLLTILATLVVGLRVITRSMIIGRMFLDDWAMVATMIFAYAFLLELVVSIRSFNAGYSGAQLSVSDMIGILKLTVAIIVTYKALLTMIRVSILCFYLRLAVQKSFDTMCRYTLVFVALFFAIFASATVGQCVPLYKLWDFTGQVEGRCINTNIFYHTGTVIQIMLDIWILVLPYKLATSIPRPWHEKLSLVVIFSLGVLSIGAAIARLAFLHIFTASKDPFADILPIHIWSMVETNLSIICACLPTLKPLVSRSQRNRTRVMNGYGSEKGENMDSESQSIASEVKKETDITVLIRQSLRPPVPPKTAQSDEDFDSSMEAFRAAKRLEAQFR